LSWQCRWVRCTLDHGKDLAVLLHPSQLVVLALDVGASSAATSSWLAHRPGLKPAETSSPDKQPVWRRPTLAMLSQVSEGCLHLRKINRVNKVVEGHSKDVLSRVSGNIAHPWCGLGKSHVSKMFCTEDPSLWRSAQVGANNRCSANEDRAHEGG